MFRGSHVALITPFLEDGNVDFVQLGKLIEWQIDNNSDGIVILGTTGESATLSDEERVEVVEFAVKSINGRVLTIAGSGSNNPIHAQNLSLKYQELGVDALLVVNPYYNKGNFEGIYKYYEMINEVVSIPILLYNVPSRTGLNMDFELVKKLKGLSNVKGIKDASGQISHIAEIASLVDDEFCLLSGNDDHVIPLLSLGGIGVISAAANVIPNIMHQMVSLYSENKVNAARDLQLKYLSLINTLFIECNPIPAKKALEFLGFNTGILRLPLVPLKEDHCIILKEEMEKVGLI